MRKFLAKLLIGASITAIGAFGADNSLGSWKLNLEKSAYNPGPATVKNLTTTRDASENGVKATSTGELANGNLINSSYTGKYSSTSQTVISDDGNTTTVTSKGTNAEGIAFNNILVYNKQ